MLYFNHILISYLLFFRVLIVEIQTTVLSKNIYQISFDVKGKK